MTGVILLMTAARQLSRPVAHPTKAAQKVARSVSKSESRSDSILEADDDSPLLTRRAT